MQITLKVRIEFQNSKNNNISVAHHTKYLDLLSKSTMLDDTTENYPQQIVIYQQDIEEFSDAVVLILRKISANLKKVNLEDQITDLDERGLTLQTGNVDELKESRFDERLKITLIKKYYFSACSTSRRAYIN